MPSMNVLVDGKIGFFKKWKEGGGVVYNVSCMSSGIPQGAITYTPCCSQFFS